MSHPDPRHDPENVRIEDSKFAPKATSPRSKALHKKMNAAQKASKKWLKEGAKQLSGRKDEAPLQRLKRLLKK